MSEPVHVKFKAPAFGVKSTELHQLLHAVQDANRPHRLLDYDTCIQHCPDLTMKLVEAMCPDTTVRKVDRARDLVPFLFEHMLHVFSQNINLAALRFRLATRSNHIPSHLGLTRPDPRTVQQWLETERQERSRAIRRMVEGLNTHPGALIGLALDGRVRFTKNVPSLDRNTCFPRSTKWAKQANTVGLVHPINLKSLPTHFDPIVKYHVTELKDCVNHMALMSTYLEELRKHLGTDFLSKLQAPHDRLSELDHKTISETSRARSLRGSYLACTAEHSCSSHSDTLRSVLEMLQICGLDYFSTGHAVLCGDYGVIRQMQSLQSQSLVALKKLYTDITQQEVDALKSIKLLPGPLHLKLNLCEEVFKDLHPLLSEFMRNLLPKWKFSANGL